MTRYQTGTYCPNMSVTIPRPLSGWTRAHAYSLKMSWVRSFLMYVKLAVHQ